MTVNGDGELERTIAFVVADYEDRGYHVVVAPSAGQISPELASRSVDMIAVRDDDRVLIELKRRSGARTELAFVELAQLAEAAGWRVEFALVAPYGPRDGPRSHDERAIRDRLAELFQEKDLGEGGPESTAEARERIDTALRLILGEPSRSDDRTIDLLVSAWSLGYIAEEHEYTALFEVVAAAQEGEEVSRARRAEASDALIAAHQRWVSFPAGR